MSRIKEDSSISRNHLRARAIIERLRARGFVYEVSNSFLIEAIKVERGGDPRTIKKWIDFLVENGYLEATERPGVYRIRS